MRYYTPADETTAFKCDECGKVEYTDNPAQGLPGWKHTMQGTDTFDVCPTCREYDEYVDDVWTNPDIKIDAWGKPVPGR